jgi:hypothetical protein
MLHPWGISFDLVGDFTRHNARRRAIRTGDGKRAKDEFHPFAGKWAGSAQMLTNQHTITQQALMYGPGKALSRAAMHRQIRRGKITSEQLYLP